jgi:hypothetical protein
MTAGVNEFMFSVKPVVDVLPARSASLFEKLISPIRDQAMYFVYPAFHNVSRNEPYRRSRYNPLRC